MAFPVRSIARVRAGCRGVVATGVVMAGVCLPLAAGCGGAWAADAPQAAPPPPASPEPERTQAGQEAWSFARCTVTISDDPDGARDYAEDWLGHGGGLEAQQCEALARIELGDVATAAALLDRLAHVPGWPMGPPAAVHAAGAQPDSPQSLHRRAAVAEQAARAWQADDNPKQAFDSATYGLTLEPGDVPLRLVYARVAVELDQPERAIAALTPLPSAPAERDEALVARAAAWRRMGRIEQAMDDINVALKDMPHNGAALLERGILYQREGQMAQARADWQDVVKLAPDSDEADLARQDLSLLETDPEAP